MPACQPLAATMQLLTACWRRGCPSRPLLRSEGAPLVSCGPGRRCAGPPAVPRRRAGQERAGHQQMRACAQHFCAPAAEKNLKPLKPRLCAQRQQNSHRGTARGVAREVYLPPACPSSAETSLSTYLCSRNIRASASRLPCIIRICVLMWCPCWICVHAAGWYMCPSSGRWSWRGDTKGCRLSNGSG